MNSSKVSPDISIVLPTYNVGRYIDRCLESCINQTHKNIEIIVVDDCGNDDSIDKARLWASNNPEIKIIHNPRNLGTYHARRHGVANSSGDYIIFLDPDDALEPETAHEIFSAAQKKSPDIIFFGTSEIHKKKSGETKLKTQRPPLLKNNLKKEFILQRPTNLGTSGKAYLKPILDSAFSLIDIPEEERLIFGEDALILCLALHLSSNGISIRKNLYNYHINESSITVQKSISDVRFQQLQIDKILSYLDKARTQSNSNIQDISIFQHFGAKLRSDKHMLARHTLDEAGLDKYFQSITHAFLELPTLKDLIRLSLYIGSIGRLRF